MTDSKGNSLDLNGTLVSPNSAAAHIPQNYQGQIPALWTLHMDEHHKDAYDLIEYDDYWLIPFGGTSVAKIIIDLVLRIEFLDATQLETLIWIGGELELKTQGKEHKLKGDNPKGLAPVIDLWGRVVESALAHKDGRLEIRFRDGNSLCAYPLPETEAWGVTGQRWLRIVCMPGGDLAVWEPDPPESDK